MPPTASPQTAPSRPVGDRLVAFVPRLAVELGRAPVPSWSSVDGSMLSADISGFTALSEKLAGKGRAGAEEITALVNTCFTALIDAAYAHAGEVIKFGGDALLILFRGPAHERRAADAGLAMQRALHSSTAAKRANLTMTVGVAAGPFDVFLAGSDYRELLITGARASEVIRLEGEAAKGDTLVDRQVAERLPRSMKVREEAGGWLVRGSTGDPPIGPDPRAIADDDLAPYVPATVVEQLAAFSGTGGEHRLVTVGFLMVGGVAGVIERDGPAAAARALHRLVDDVVRIGATYGVTALHTDIAPDGVKFVLCAGAPLNRGDTSDALLHAALELARVDSPFVLRQGVQTGRVFAGFLGSSHRRTYTLMGDPVNTAARMLGKAGDRDVVAVESVVRDTRTVFHTEELEPFLVKGKTHPIVAHRVLAATEKVRHDTSATSLIGRQRELDVLTHAVGELGEVVVISGPAGVGKTRLLDAALSAAEGLRAFHGACTPYGVVSPYSVFRVLLRAGSQIDVDADPATAGRALHELVTHAAPHLLPMLPLLAIAFGATVEPTPESEAVDPQFRRARIHDAVVDYLDSLLDGPALLVVEDLHWIDEASGELLDHLIAASATRPWAGVLTQRPTSAWSPTDAPHVRRLDLAPLTEDDIRSIAIEVSDRPLSDAELQLVVGRAGGNPLFAIELSRALGRTRTGAAVDDLPESIEGLIASRIDALPAQQRHLLRVAAVFGREFDLRRVSAIGDEDLTVTDGLDELIERLDATPVTFRFRHAMYRDVAYAGLPFRERRRLHASTARLLERELDDPDRIASLLSLHYSAAGQHADAYRYACQAAADAAAAYAHAEATEHYERALHAARYCRDVDRATRARLYEQLGRSREFAGDLVGADDAYRRVPRLTDDLETVAACLRRRARIRQKQSHLDPAVRLLRKAALVLATTEETPWVHRRLAEIELNLSGLRMDQGRLDEARHHAELARSHAEAAGDRSLLVQAYGAIVGALTDWTEAEPYVELGLGPAAPADAYEARSILAINLGMAAFFAGRWTEAVELYEEGRVNAQTMGNVTGAALASMNAAEVLLDQGHLERADAALGEVRRVLAAAGYAAALSYAELLMGVLALRQGDLERARTTLGACRRAFREGSMLLYALETELRLAEVDVCAGDLAAAEAIVDQVLVEAPALSRRAVVVARAQRLLGAIAHARGDSQAGVEHLRDAADTCRSGSLRFELAVTLAALDEVVDDPDARADAAAIFDELGVTERGRRVGLVRPISG